MADGSGQQINPIKQEIQTFLERSALQGMSEKELLAEIAGALLARSEERSDPIVDQPIDENAVIQEKTLLYPPSDRVYIYRHKGRNWYYRERSGEDQTGPYYNGASLGVGTNKQSALEQAHKWHLKGTKRKNAGVLRQSLNTTELIRRYEEFQQKRIKLITKRGLTQESFDAKFQKLSYWQEYIKEKGFEHKPLHEIPKDIGMVFAEWVDDRPKQVYKDKPRSVETINAVVGAAQALYWWAIDKTYINSDHMPKFKRLDSISKDESEERDCLWEDEWHQLEDHLLQQWKDKNQKEITRAINGQTYWYFKLLYSTGMRLREVNNLRWNQVTTPIHEKGRRKEILRSIYIGKTKTGRKRTITCEVAYIFNGLHKIYQDRGIEIDRKSDTRVFFKLHTNRYDLDSWVTDKTMVDRLDKAMKETGLYQKLEKEMPPRRITPNSARHYVATYKKVNENWDWDKIALFLGHEPEMTRRRYSKVTSAMLSAKEEIGTGLAAIEQAVFKDPFGNIKPDFIQEISRDGITNAILGHPENMTFETVNGEPTLVCLLSKEDLEVVQEENPDFKDGDLYQLRDGSRVMFRCQR